MIEAPRKSRVDMEFVHSFVHARTHTFHTQQAFAGHLCAGCGSWFGDPVVREAY